MNLTPYTALQWVLVIFIGLVGILVLQKMWVGKIALDTLLSESDGKASLSRFQLLLFTFVIAGIYAVICLQTGELSEISPGVLGLLGTSSGAYVISKGIQNK